MLPLRDQCQNFCQDGLHRVQKAAHPKGCKALTTQLLKFVCNRNGLAKFISVLSLFADSLVRVDHRVDHKVTREVKDLLKQQMVGGVKLERNMPP